MSDNSDRMNLNSAIEALLAEGSIEERLFNVNRSIAALEQHGANIPDRCLETLKDIADQLARSNGSRADEHSTEHYLSPEQEFALAEELLSLYITASGGVLMF